MKEINLFKYLTVKRIFNAAGIIASFMVSRAIRKPLVWGMPVSYSIEPTNHCNLKCPECPSGLGALTRPLGLLKNDDFIRLIDQIKDTGFYIQLFFQGEPYINKNLPEMIRYAQSQKIYVSISTNGHFVNENNVDKILQDAPDKLIFSVDGLDEKSYQKYRVGGTFKQADEGLRLITKRKKELGLDKPFIEFQFIVMKQNEHQLDEVRKYCKDAGVDKLVFKTMQVTSFESAVEYLPINEQYRRYVVSDDSYQMKGKLLNHCFALWRTSVITWDGKVVPCCFDKDAKYELGSLSSKSFSEIWKSEPYQQFRRGVLDDRAGLDMCTNCTEGLKVNILEVSQ